MTEMLLKLAEQPKAEKQRLFRIPHVAFADSHEQYLINDTSPTESFNTRPGVLKGFFLSPRKIFCHQPLFDFCVFFQNSSLTPISTVWRLWNG